MGVSCTKDFKKSITTKLSRNKIPNPVKSNNHVYWTYSKKGKAIKYQVGVKECQICFREESLEQFRQITEKCRHEVQYCSQCIQKHIQAQMSNGNFDNIRCPCDKCNKTLKTTDAKKFFMGRQGEFERLDRIVRNKKLNAGNIITNLVCFKKYSNRHDKKFKESLAWIESNSTLCPSCKIPIQKIEGCDHMTCRKPGGCGKEFCWICQADWKKIKYLGDNWHKKTCRD